MSTLPLRTIRPSAHTVGVWLVLGSCFSLQFGSAFAVHLFPHIGAWGVSLLRLGFASLIVLAFIRPNLRVWNTHQWKATILFGISLGLMNGFFYQAIARIPLGLAVAIEFVGPLILAIALSRRLIDFLWALLAAIGLIILGVDALNDSSNIDLLGVLYALIAGGFWAAYVITSTRLGSVIQGASGLAVGLFIAALTLLPLGAAGATIVFSDIKLLLFALATALFSSLVPATFEFAALRRIPQNTFSILLSLEPAIAAIAGWILLAQHTGLYRWAAIILLVIASIGITISSRSKVVGANVALRKRRKTS
ncbi:EamA family transporter [Rothia sp. P13129]|uniref:EamA family transporter n=1 Tax=Rothia sp. P13129 TaxID=3402664 RepID=UPI003AC0F10A